jgi:hypothetical protein
MKIVHYVPPLVALIIATAWLASLRASNRDLEQDNRSIQTKIAESRGSLASQNERARMGAKSDRTRANSARAKRETIEVKPLSEFMPTAHWHQPKRNTLVYNEIKANKSCFFP